jgi:aerobic-type carbon monoxide dehydrogenase small subunit (CoxS/CutS family)
MTDLHPRPSAFSRRSFLKSSAAAGLAGATVGAAAPILAGKPETFGPGEHEIQLRINGQNKIVKVETRTTLLDALRDRLDLTGAKKICDRGSCGGCTVLLGGDTITSCMTFAMDCIGSEITTIESLSDGQKVHPLVQNFASCDALQCGFCTPGMVMAAVGLLSENPKPTERQVREGLEGNLCRCTGYHNIVRAVIAASGQDPDEVQGAAIHRVTDAGGVEAAAGFSSGDSAGGGE